VRQIFVLEDHSVHGGLGEYLLHEMNQDQTLSMCSVHILGLEEYPVWGTPQEVLEHHRLCGSAIAQRIQTCARVCSRVGE